MSRTTPIELTNMCLVYDKEQVLVQEKVGIGKTGGLVFPGGHVEPFETLAQSVIREIKEETGLTIANPKLCGVKDWMKEDGSRYVVLLYKTNEFEGELKSSSEGRVFWLKREEIETAKFVWNMKELLEIFESDSYSEFFLKELNGNYIWELL
ncbi:MutT/nudix family protein [Lachnospiraceae bacterium TWA4]|nr:MutT/nudix family protein [Lachnospiraceae bacterium TWA4]